MKIGSVVWGVEDIPRAVAFWSAALNYKLKREMSHDWAILVPVDGEVERLLALGAVKKNLGLSGGRRLCCLAGS